MLYTIARNGPVSLLIGGMLFSGLLSVATAQTDETEPARRAAQQTDPVRRPDVPLRERAAGAIDAQREVFKARAAELRENAAKRAEALNTRLLERRERISEEVENRVRTALGNATSRLTNAVSRLGAVADRLEARARALAERGISVDAALAQIDEARTELRAASVSINEDLSAETDAAVTAEEPRAAFEYVKTSIREAHTHLKRARELLRGSVAELKAAIAQRGNTEIGTPQ